MKLDPGSLHGTQSTISIPGPNPIQVPGPIETTWSGLASNIESKFQAQIRGSPTTAGGGGQADSREGSEEVAKKDGGARFDFFGSR